MLESYNMIIYKKGPLKEINAQDLKYQIWILQLKIFAPFT